jgi:septum formation protein
MASAGTISKLILASGSPRRRDLLNRAGITFTIRPADIDEIRRDGEGAQAFALRMANEKALAVAGHYPAELILAADTIVELDNQVLGKPVDADDARRILRRLSGRTHRVVTAYAIARHGSVAEAKAVISHVTFRHLDDAEIEHYLATGEPFDKAGAYGIQGTGADFITAVEGDRSNVMGLPVNQVLIALARHGVHPSSVRGQGND